jgi:chromate transporter
VLAPSYKRWAKNQKIKAFVSGVTAAATGAIAGSVVVLARRSLYDGPTIVIALLSLGLLIKWKIPEPVIIALAAVVGLALRSSSVRL